MKWNLEEEWSVHNENPAGPRLASSFNPVELAPEGTTNCLTDAYNRASAPRLVLSRFSSCLITFRSCLLLHTRTFIDCLLLDNLALVLLFLDGLFLLIFIFLGRALIELAFLC